MLYKITTNYIFKIGGSVLFDEKGNFLDCDLLLKTILFFSKNIIIVIGCGEYMHDLVIDNDLTDKCQMKINDEKREIKAKEIIKELNTRLEKLAFKYNLNYEYCQNMFVKNSLGSKTSHEIESFNSRKIKLPFITSGGLVTDKRINYSAISSDTIATYLSKEFYSSKILFLTDVDGIYFDMNSKTLIEKIEINDIGKYDLKSGMVDKVRRISNVVNSNIEVYVLSGKNIQNLQKLLRGEKAICTKILI